MKKLLWFLIGMAIIASIPVFLFNWEAPSKPSPPKGMEVRKDQLKKPALISDAKIPTGKAGSPEREASSAK
jgi:hypothetical protein